VVGERQRAVGARERPCEVDHPNTRERSPVFAAGHRGEKLQGVALAQDHRVVDLLAVHDVGRGLGGRDAERGHDLPRALSCPLDLAPLRSELLEFAVKDDADHGRRRARTSGFPGTRARVPFSSVSELLPLFPLGSVLFPGALLPLHIFEPRYRLLIRRSVERERPFGIVLIRSGAEVGPAAVPHAIGTEARIVAVSRLADGRSYIITRGERRFAVDALVSDAEPYLVGRVRYLAEPEGDDPSSHLDEALEALGRYLVAVLAVTDDARGERALTEELKGVAPVEVAWRIAGSIAVDPVEQQALLEMPSASERLVEETRILRRETDQLGDLLVRLRAQGERQELN